MDKTFLRNMLEAVSVSGNEEPVQRLVMEHVRDFADRVKTDAVGNVMAAVNPDSPFKMVLMGHSDEIGFMVTHVNDDGTVKVQKAGGVRPSLYVGAPMQILHNGQKVNAVGCVIADLLKKESVSDTDLVLDIGASSKEEAESLVSVGDPVCADSSLRSLAGERFTSRALDDKTGVAVVLEAARRAKAKGAKVGIYAVSTVGEETSGRGAFFASGAVKADGAIAVDVTWASDCPGTNLSDTGFVQLGKGPVICRSGMVNRRMNEALEAAAKAHEIPYQLEVAGGRTYTDGDTISASRHGVPIALVSIPLRYMHSSVEVADWRDLDNAAELISEFLVSLTEDFDFRPY